MDALRAQPSARPRRVGDRLELLDTLEQIREEENSYLRRLIIDGDRIDVLAEMLGYEVAPNVHRKIIMHQYAHPLRSMVQIFRGAGKTTIGTVTKIIHLILKDRDLRILIASKTATNAKKMLTEIKGHLERNERLREVFGDFVGDETWNDEAIRVSGTKRISKEPTITTIGVLGAVASGHYDVLICDDLCDEENSRTEHQRKKLHTWFYKLLLPTLMPPSKTNPLVGQLHVLGTRFHFNDLHGHFLDNEMKGERTLVIKALQVNPETGEEESPWPEMYSTEHFQQMRKDSGFIIFNSQFQCDTEAMKGEIFRYDDCKVLKRDELPKPESLRIYMGVDLAITQTKESDYFAIVVAGIEPSSHMVYVLDYYEGHLRFNAQTKKIFEMNAKWNPIKIGIETVAYQEAQYQNIEDKDRKCKVPIVPIKTNKDKVTRAHQLTPRFEAGHVHFVAGEHEKLIERFVLFPSGPKDVFDAFDLALSSSQRRARRRPRAAEPGLL